jgi:hypothetical protein
MSVYESRGQLAKAMKTLQLNWMETRGDWDDAISRAFEKEFLEPLEMDLRNAMGAMDTMNGLLQQIERDCK